MAIIQNSDYSVGTVRRFNQYEQDNAEAQKYRYHQLLQNNRFGEQHPDKAKTVDWRNVTKSGAPASTNTPATFNSKLQEFFFSPPSDNLWNVQIELSTLSSNGNKNESTNILQLFQYIKTVNKVWEDLHEEGWSISGIDGKNKSKSTAEKFLQHLCEGEMGVFLAQRINYTPISVSHEPNPFNELSGHGGFYKNAKVVRARSGSDELKINFLISNWDITEVLIDPWIAAVAQHGLIADEIQLRAKIILTEFSASHPKFSSEETYKPMMEARKQYIFENCYPISRDTNEKVYDLEEAGTFKTSMVTFAYDDYKIKYLF